MAGNPPSSRHETPGCARHAELFQHRPHATISFERNIHSLPSERRGGPGPTWLSEGGWAGGGGGKMEADGFSLLECSPPARRRRASALTVVPSER